MVQADVWITTKWHSQLRVSAETVWCQLVRPAAESTHCQAVLQSYSPECRRVRARQEHSCVEDRARRPEHDALQVHGRPWTLSLHQLHTAHMSHSVQSSHQQRSTMANALFQKCRQKTTSAHRYGTSKLCCRTLNNNNDDPFSSPSSRTTWVSQ